MTSVAVFVFLLDNVAGFNHALNETLTENAMYAHSNETPFIQNCDPLTTDQILSAVSQDLDLVIVPTFRQDSQLNNDNEQYKEQSPEIFNTVFDNSLHDAENIRDLSYERNLNVFDDDFRSFYRRSFDKNEPPVVREMLPVPEVQVKNIVKPEFPKSAPFLVAIFETLANITAQTCAGTLLTPRWVLTAANCINILSNMYANNTNVTHSSQYTIVAGSSNPLTDGTAHNVTAVLVHPGDNSSRTARAPDADGPYLALMRIEPGVEGPAMELMPDEVHDGEVMVYGWILSKNESEHDTLNRTSMAGEILSPAECQTMYSYKDNDVICLYTRNMDKNITQLSSGGPVLMAHQGKVKMLGVVQTDEHVFVSYPLAGHYDWITHTIRNK